MNQPAATGSWPAAPPSGGPVSGAVRHQNAGAGASPADPLGDPDPLPVHDAGATKTLLRASAPFTWAVGAVGDRPAADGRDELFADVHARSVYIDLSNPLAEAHR